MQTYSIEIFWNLIGQEFSSFWGQFVGFNNHTISRRDSACKRNHNTLERRAPRSNNQNSPKRLIFSMTFIFAETTWFSNLHEWYWTQSRFTYFDWFKPTFKSFYKIFDFIFYTGNFGHYDFMFRLWRKEFEKVIVLTLPKSHETVLIILSSFSWMKQRSDFK